MSVQVITDQFSFKKDNDFIDVTVHHTEGWLELKIETTDSFPIETQEELDVIYQKLSEALKTLK
jgi:hypothetical protein